MKYPDYFPCFTSRPRTRRSALPSDRRWKVSVMPWSLTVRLYFWTRQVPFSTNEMILVDPLPGTPFETILHPLAVGDIHDERAARD